MTIIPICSLVTSLSISSDLQLMKVITDGNVKYFDPFESVVPLQTDIYKNKEFQEIMSSSIKCAVVRCETDASDAIPDDIFEKVENGKQVKLPLEGFAGSDPEGKDWEVTVFLILRKEKGKTYTLGLIGPVEEEEFKKVSRFLMKRVSSISFKPLRKSR